jgi:membrane-associated phospholipid phosphatase
MSHTALYGTGHRYLPHPRAPRAWRSVPRELAIVASGVVLYFGVRGQTASNIGHAHQHAHDIVSFEKSLGVYVEPDLQHLLDNRHWLTTLLNWVYIWGHWPVITLVLLWLVLEHPAAYRVTRNSMIASGSVGLVLFAVYPVAPPRLADLGLVDTVTTYSSAYRFLQPAAFVNQYAAMPSLHVGWDLLIGIVLVQYGRNLLTRVVGVVLPMLMVVSVVMTANHYLSDVVVGAALVLVSRAAALRLERWQVGRRRAPIPRAEVP